MPKPAARRATVTAVARNQTPNERICMSAYHDRGESTMVLYDLGNPEAWERAGREAQAWGKDRTTVYSLSSEHIVIEYRAGGARDLEGTA